MAAKWFPLNLHIRTSEVSETYAVRFPSCKLALQKHFENIVIARGEYIKLKDKTLVVRLNSCFANSTAATPLARWFPYKTWTHVSRLVSRSLLAYASSDIICCSYSRWVCRPHWSTCTMHNRSTACYALCVRHTANGNRVTHLPNKRWMGIVLITFRAPYVGKHFDSSTQCMLEFMGIQFVSEHSTAWMLLSVWFECVCRSYWV